MPRHVLPLQKRMYSSQGKFFLHHGQDEFAVGFLGHHGVMDGGHEHLRSQTLESLAYGVDDELPLGGLHLPGKSFVIVLFDLADERRHLRKLKIKDALGCGSEAILGEEEHDDLVLGGFPKNTESVRHVIVNLPLFA